LEFPKTAGDEYQSIFQDTEISAAIRESIVNPENWQLDGKGFTITFQSCAVAPCPLPKVPVTIPWADLKPYLNPDFIPPPEQ
jgi:hypothetical protein